MNKKNFLWVGLALLVAGVAGAASSIFTDIWSVTGTGSLSNTSVAYVDSTYDMNLYKGDLVLEGTASKPSATAGTYPGIKVYLKNCGGSSWVQGNLIIVDDEEEGCGQASTATADLTDWVGIAEGTVAAGSSGYVTVGGYALALTTGTVNRGDTLISTAGAAGYLGADITPTTGADVGVALSSGTQGGGLTVIRLR